MAGGDRHIIPALLYADACTDHRLFMDAVVQRARATFDFTMVASWREAINYISGRGRFADRRHAQPPDLVLANFLLGTGSAIDLLLWMRKRPAYALLPVVVLIDINESDASKYCLEAGAAACLPKPRGDAGWGHLVTVLQLCLAPRVPNLGVLGGILNTTWVRQQLRHQVRANMEERRRVVEERSASILHLDQTRALQKEIKKQFPFPRKRVSSELPNNVFIQNRQTGRLLTADSQWTRERHAALGFETTAEARVYCVQRGQVDVDIIIDFGLNVRIPFRPLLNDGTSPELRR